MTKIAAPTPKAINSGSCLLKIQTSEMGNITAAEMLLRLTNLVRSSIQINMMRQINAVSQ
jgi:hypothetical protein